MQPLEENIMANARRSATSGNLEEAFRLAKSIPKTSSHFLESFQFRLGLVLHDLRALDKSRFEEFVILLQTIAENPEFLEIRTAIEHFFTSSLEEPFSKTVLAALIQSFGTQRFTQAIQKLKNGQQLKSDLSTFREEIDEDACCLFMEKAFTALSGTLVLGSKDLSNEAKLAIRPSYVRILLEAIEKHEDMPELNLKEIKQSRLSFLHILVLVCKHLEEPFADFLGAHYLVQHFATLGNPQDARDLAETGLLTFRNTQTKALACRTSLAWLCFSEAFNRSNNPLAAARCYVFSILTFDAEHTTVDWLTRYFRLAFQICRNLHYFELALHFLTLRKELAALTIKKPSPEFLQKLNTEELSLELQSSGFSSEKMQEILNRSLELLKNEIKEEEQSIVTIACNAIRILQMQNADVSLATLDEIKHRLRCYPEPLRKRFELMISNCFDSKALLEMLQSVHPSTHSIDLASSVTPLLPVALKAIPLAYQENDSTLFFTASNLLCQPTLSQNSSVASKDVDSAKEWKLLLASGERDLNKLSAAYLASDYSEIGEFSLSNLRDVSILKCQATLADGELLILLVSDEQANLHRMLLSKDHIGSPEKIPDNVWSSEAYSEWRKSYPRNYSDWEPPQPLRSETPSVQSVFDSFTRLSIGNLPVTRLITVVPVPSLFGFPFNMLSEPEKKKCFWEKHLFASAHPFLGFCQLDLNRGLATHLPRLGLVLRVPLTWLCSGYAIN